MPSVISLRKYRPYLAAEENIIIDDTDFFRQYISRSSDIAKMSRAIKFD